MGYVSIMTLTNDRSEALRTFIDDVQCMYEHGQYGSRLDIFDNAVIQPRSAFPAKGANIQAKASGACNSMTSHFDLKVTRESDGVTLGTLHFWDSNQAWGVSNNTNKDLLHVNIDNAGDQGIIEIIVAKG